MKSSRTLGIRGGISRRFRSNKAPPKEGGNGDGNGGETTTATNSLKKRLTSFGESVQGTLRNYDKPEVGNVVQKSPSIVGLRLWGVSSSNVDDENAALEEEMPGYCLTNTIHPDSRFRQQWNFASLLVVLYCCIDIPVDICFYPSIEVNAGFVVNCIFDIFFIVDIFLNMNTGFEKHGVVIMDRRLARNKYLKNGFIIDFIASVPIDYLSFANNGGGNMTKASKLIRVLRIFRLVRLFRLPRIFRYSRRFTDKIHSGYLRVLKLIFLLLLFAHWNACLLYLISSLNTKDET